MVITNHASFRFITRAMGIDIKEDDMTKTQHDFVKMTMLDEMKDSSTLPMPDVEHKIRLHNWGNAVAIVMNDVVITVKYDSHGRNQNEENVGKQQIVLTKNIKSKLKKRQYSKSDRY